MKTEAIMAIRINATAYETVITKMVEANARISPQVRKKFLSVFLARTKAEDQCPHSKEQQA